MKSLHQYGIPFTGLKTGVHEFEYKIGDAFFDEFEYSLVKRGDLKVAVALEKQETMLILDFRIEGKIRLQCDVCLSDYPHTVNIEERQIVKFAGDDETDEIIVLGKHETEINVASLMYEYITVAVPYITRCGDEGNTEWCDQQMIEKLRLLSAKDESPDADDPRWEALKKIKK